MSFPRRLPLIIKHYRATYVVCFYCLLNLTAASAEQSCPLPLGFVAFMLIKL